MRGLKVVRLLRVETVAGYLRPWDCWASYWWDWPMPVTMQYCLGGCPWRGAMPRTTAGRIASSTWPVVPCCGAAIIGRVVNVHRPRALTTTKTVYRHKSEGNCPVDRLLLLTQGRIYTAFS
jgi:hypothetical protein